MEPQQGATLVAAPHHLASPSLTVNTPLPPPPLPLIPTQIKGTVLLTPSGSDRITSAPLQPLGSEKGVEDEEIKALLATRWAGVAGEAAGAFCQVACWWISWLGDCCCGVV